MLQHNKKWIVIALVVAATALAAVVSRSAMSLEPGPPTEFDDIVAVDPTEYGGYQVKLTYTGTQTKTTPSLLLVGPDRAPDVGEFTPFRSPGVHYGNDDDRVIDLTVSGSTIQRLIELGLVPRPELQVNAADQIAGGLTDPVLSLMIEPGVPAPPAQIVFEHLADDIDASTILTLLQGAAVAEPPDTRETIRRFRNFTVGPN